jgi:hypothetical protein
MKIIISILLFSYLLYLSLSTDKCFPRIYEIESKMYYLINGNITEGYLKMISDLNSKKQYMLSIAKDFEKKDQTILYLLRYDLKKAFFYNVEKASCYSYPISEVKKKKKFKIKNF